MDVYDEVDRRETDAGKVKRICSLQHSLVSFLLFFYSVVGNTKPQHPSDGDDSGAFPSREPRVFVHAQPGTSAPHNCPSCCECAAIWPQLTLSRFPCLGTAETGEI